MKVCRVCSIEKELSEFYPNKQCKLGVTGTCRSCTRVRISSWYSNNRIRRQEAANNLNKKRKREVVNHFGHKCHDCGGTFPLCVYAFHHLDPTQKDVNPSEAMKSPTNMWKELEKCIMLCANCHMIRHHGSEV